jgi:putative FmdB family regulatory protein
MALYDFSCNDCKYIEEKMMPMAKRDEPQKCPKCGKKMVRQLPTGSHSPGLAFHGTGFYQTDVVHKRELQKEGQLIKKRMKEGKSQKDWQ